jgi:hypothetical protein
LECIVTENDSWGTDYVGVSYQEHNADITRTGHELSLEDFVSELSGLQKKILFLAMFRSDECISEWEPIQSRQVPSARESLPIPAPPRGPEFFQF